MDKLNLIEKIDGNEGRIHYAYNGELNVLR